MAIASYDLGDRVRLGNHTLIPTATPITDLTGAPADPTTVTLTTEAPDGTLVTYTYLGSPALLRETVGRYYVDVTLPTAGLWTYRLLGSGAVVVAEEAQLHVRQQMTG